MNLTNLKIKKPTAVWRTFAYEGDDHYTEDLLSQCETILDEYVDDLDQLGPQPSGPQILDCVKKAVVQLNTLDSEHAFIETLEREDLCDFIFIAAKTAGLDSSEDVTEPWREW